MERDWCDQAPKKPDARPVIAQVPVSQGPDFPTQPQADADAKPDNGWGFNYSA